MAHCKVIAHVQEYARLEECLGGSKRPGEGFRLEAIEGMGSRAKTKLNNQSLEQCEVAILSRSVARQYAGRRLSPSVIMEDGEKLRSLTM